MLQPTVESAGDGEARSAASDDIDGGAGGTAWWNGTAKDASIHRTDAPPEVTEEKGNTVFTLPRWLRPLVVTGVPPRGGLGQDPHPPVVVVGVREAGSWLLLGGSTPEALAHVDGIAQLLPDCSSESNESDRLIISLSLSSQRMSTGQ